MFVLNEKKREQSGEVPHAHPQRAHTHRSQMWVLGEGWGVNTDEKTRWVCCTSVALLL